MKTMLPVEHISLKMPSMAGQSAKLQTKIQTCMAPSNHQFSLKSCTFIFYFCFSPKALETLGVFNLWGLKITFSLKNNDITKIH